MARRCTTTMLMMAYLASQLAMVPHAHGSDGEHQPCDHDARSHVHVSWFEHDGHSHDHDHSHHHECDGNHSQPSSTDANTGHEDHDSDAVYLPSDTAVSLPSKTAVSLDGLHLIATIAVAAVVMPTAISQGSLDAHFLDECRPVRPLYLALRALRI